MAARMDSKRHRQRRWLREGSCWGAAKWGHVCGVFANKPPLLLLLLVLLPQVCGTVWRVARRRRRRRSATQRQHQLATLLLLHAAATATATAAAATAAVAVESDSNFDGDRGWVCRNWDGDGDWDREGKGDGGCCFVRFIDFWAGLNAFRLTSVGVVVVARAAPCWQKWNLNLCKS